MEKIEMVFSNIYKKVKPLFKKCKPVVKLLKPISNMMKKLKDKMKNIYRKAYNKTPYTEPIVIIGTSLLIVLLIVVTLKGAFKQNIVTITNNKAEELYYQNKYDEALIEYEKLQKDEKWPIWLVKQAEIHSVKGDINKSNSLLKEAILIRDKIIQEEGIEELKEKDSEFMNLVVFTFFMNKKYDEALSLAEAYIIDNGQNKEMMRSIFTIYLVKNQQEKAKEMLDIYPVDEDSAYDLATLAKMNMLVDEWNKGFDILKQSWEIDKNEVKIYDVITQFAAYDRDSVLSKLIALSEENPNDACYKVWIAKVYSMLPETANIADEILNKLENEDIGEVTLNIMKSQIYKNTGRKEEADALLKEIINNKEESYIGYHIAAWQAFESGKYDEAFELCKKSIMQNKDYPDNYGFLIPEIMMAKGNVELLESYFRTALEKEPFNYNIMIKIGDYYANTALDNEKAREYYNLALSIKPNDSELYYNLATLDILDGKEEDAVNNLEKAISIKESVGKYHRTLGTLYLNKGEYEKAIESIRNAYSIDKNDVLALSNAGCYYISIEGDIERGMENISAAYKDMPSNIDEENKKAIIDNYNKAKNLYDKFIEGGGEELKVPDFKLFY